MKKLFKYLSVSILFLMSVAFADTKIGVLNLQQVIQESPQLNSIKSSLQKQFTASQQKIVDAQKNLQDDMANMQKNAAVMKPADRTALQDQIAKKQQELQAMQADFQQNYFAARDKAFGKLLSQIKQVVETYAKANQYDLIVTNDAVAYASSGMDVTKDILKALKK